MASKPGLYANIHAKKKRIAAGSGEKMRKVGAKVPHLRWILSNQPRPLKTVNKGEHREKVF